MKNLMLAVSLISAISLTGCAFSKTPEISQHGDAETKQAIETKNPDLCLGLPDSIKWENPWDGDVSYINPKQSCLEKYVYAINVPSNCDLLEEYHGRTSCLDYMAKIYSDPGICKLRESEPDSWLNYPKCIAIATLDEEKCFDILTNKLENPVNPHLKAIRAGALGDCTSQIGIEKRDYRICEKIDNVKFGYFDPNDKASPDATWKDYRTRCLMGIASCKGDSRKPAIKTQELCNLMPDGFEKKRCQENKLSTCQESIRIK